jgi:acetoin utilization deacetylase AcuC-like enzyme
MVVEVLKLVYDERHRLHRDPGDRHPEGVWRVEASVNALRRSPAWSYVEVVRALEPDYEAVLLAHDREYVEWMRRECGRGFHYVDADTYVTEHTCDVAASFAATAREAALRSVETGEPWFLLARPGGHHAGRRGPAMGAPTLGFCIFDYVSVATKALIGSGYRVMVLDFDAHHGNGTQEILWEEPRALHVDIHQRWLYPGTGRLEDVGGSGAEGTKVNVPLYPGSGDAHYAWVLERVVEVARDIFEPDVVVVFAGFDAHKDDGLSELGATENTYTLFGSYLRNLLREGEIEGLIAILGGGYGKGMATSFTAFIEGLAGFREKPPVTPTSPGEPLERGLEKVLRLLRGSTSNSP